MRPNPQSALPKTSPRRIAVVGNHPPRRRGIAPLTHDVTSALHAAVSRRLWSASRETVRSIHREALTASFRAALHRAAHPSIAAA